MGTNFVPGNVVEEFSLSWEEKPQVYLLPVGAEILECGVREKILRVYYVVRTNYRQDAKRCFLVWPTGKPLPRIEEKYPWYIGTVARRGVHVFELV